ncbi:hypothetical protein [Kiloniella sp.]|uniref:hypothetical protein n=1 Tax=Kiloniella sp. TaxID=1938587 RepID=UPI003B012F35
MLRNRTTPLKTVVKLLLLLQFFAVSLIPQGMMTDVSEGSLSLIICTADGIKEISVPNSDRQENTELNDCVFSIHSDQTIAGIQYDFIQQDLPISTTGSVSDSHLTSLLIHLAYGSRAPPTYS